ncbi:MAG: hypothetical protein JNM43_11955 [Planctomycetaceae bacterium]|nr:hypothetical protein [Planctomycetaceae bacterium]
MSTGTAQDSRPLHSAGGIVLATFLGGPFGGSVALAINYSRLGSPGASRASWLVGLIASAAYFFAITRIPNSVLDSIPNLVFIAPQLLAMFLIANWLQGRLITDHQQNGGQLCSGWKSCGIGLLCLPVSLAVLAGVVLLALAGLGTHYQSGNDEIFYSGEATEEDAARLAAVLRQSGYFGGDGVSVVLSETAGRHTVQFVVQDGAWNDPEVNNGIRVIARDIISGGFSDPLIVEFCDDTLAVRNTMTVTAADAQPQDF